MNELEKIGEVLYQKMKEPQKQQKERFNLYYFVIMLRNLLAGNLLHHRINCEFWNVCVL